MIWIHQPFWGPKMDADRRETITDRPFHVMSYKHQL